MLILKLYLLAGLVAHKVVWEVLKRKQPLGGSAQGSSKKSESFQMKAVKAVKIAILLGIAVQTLLPDIFPISSDPFIVRLAGTLIYTAGLALAIRSRSELGTNWSDIEAGSVQANHNIVANGPYRYIRHPIYIGDLLLLLGLELALNSWLVLGVLLLAPLVLRQALKEEQKLARSLPDYEAYRAQTKRFIPFVV
ncbi:MAG TPA: isoprenylcysteine carboxylmethyltransferase family protein [Pyrinomonadaceae bacterium]|jgi:protein-S-isoprenylcysteine O-methyltransferase Ste14